MNSRIMSFPLCSRVSRTNVSGLALSRKLSSFWSSRSACERACDCVVVGVGVDDGMLFIQSLSLISSKW
jgi:hypothetical protein